MEDADAVETMMHTRLVLTLIAAGSLGYAAGVLISKSGGAELSSSRVTSDATQSSAATGISGAIDAMEAAYGRALIELARPSNDLWSFVALGDALEQLDASHLLRLLEVLEGSEIARRHDELLWLLKKCVARDAGAARAWMQPRLDGLALDGLLSGTFEYEDRGRLVLAWAEADPQAAFDFARLHPQSGVATALLKGAVRGWQDRTDRERVALFLKFPPGKPRDAALLELHGSWVGGDPAAAFASAQALPAGHERERTMHLVLSVWGEGDGPAAFAQYRALKLNDSRLLSRILRGTAEKNPLQAVEWLEELDAFQRARSAPLVINAWAKQDPASAFAWALTNGFALAPKMEMSTEMEHNGFRRAGSSSTSYIDPIATALKAKPKETLAWPQSLPVGATRDQLMERVVASCSDREQATALFATLPADAAARTAGYVARMFLQEPQRGLDWARTLPHGRAREAAWEALGSFSGVDVDLPPGPDLDAYLSGTLNRSGVRQKLRDDLAIVTQIQDPIRRRQVFEETMERFYAPPWDVSEEGNAALEAADLPEQWKQPWRELAPATK
jgi:hypothetical protein